MLGLNVVKGQVVQQDKFFQLFECISFYDQVHLIMIEIWKDFNDKQLVKNWCVGL